MLIWWGPAKGSLLPNATALLTATYMLLLLLLHFCFFCALCAFVAVFLVPVVLWADVVYV